MRPGRSCGQRQGDGDAIAGGHAVEAPPGYRMVVGLMITMK